jgi:hypothetical protein
MWLPSAETLVDIDDFKHYTISSLLAVTWQNIGQQKDFVLQLYL